MLSKEVYGGQKNKLTSALGATDVGAALNHNDSGKPLLI